MNVKIGPYKNFFGPYQLAELLCFWAKKTEDEFGIRQSPDWVSDFGDWLAYGSVKTDKDDHNMFRLRYRDEEMTWLYKFLMWVDSKRKRTISIKIDRWDTWSMDTTLSHIILPMLKQLKETKHGYPHVDEMDVPEKMRIYDPQDDYNYDQGVLFEYEPLNPEHISVKSDQWDWVLDEMIFAFEMKCDDNWESRFTSGEHDFISVPCEFDENGKPKLFRLEKGPNDTFVSDDKSIQAVRERMDNGFRLFGKYFQNLWD